MGGPSCVVREVFVHHRAGSNDYSTTDGDSGGNDNLRTQKALVANSHLPAGKLPICIKRMSPNLRPLAAEHGITTDLHGGTDVDKKP